MKNRTVESKEFLKKYFCNSNKKTQNRCLKYNCMEHTVKKNSDQTDDLVIYREFFRQSDRICFWTACTNFSPFLQSEAKLGTKLENRYNGVATVVTTSKTQKSKNKPNPFWAASQKRFFKAIS